MSSKKNNNFSLLTNLAFYFFLACVIGSIIVSCLPFLFVCLTIYIIWRLIKWFFQYLLFKNKKNKDSTNNSLVLENTTHIAEQNPVTINTENKEAFYQQAKEKIILSQKASASFLQREFNISYPVAAEIICRLETEKIISPQIGSTPRKVYKASISNDYYDNVEADPNEHLLKIDNVSSDYVFTIHSPVKNIDYIYKWLINNPNTLEETSKQLKELLTINDYQINFAINTLLKNNAIFYHKHILKVNENFYFKFEYEPSEEYDLLSKIYNSPIYQDFQNINSGIEFEYFLSDMLKKQGYKTELTPKSNDYGADIIATRDNIRYAIQCKFYSNPIGISAVQEVLGAIQYYKCNIAVVATNNTYTNNAIELAEKSNVILWDGHYILKTFIDNKI